MARHQRIVVLTGAGLSAESGIATFRDQDGIWGQYDYRKVATPEGFADNPALVHDFYNQRRRRLDAVTPNAAHLALARLEREHRGEVVVVTQNVDTLHEAAGSRQVIHMHGELAKALCGHCEARFPWREDLSVATACPGCGRTGGMRPDVVWFGEFPYRMEEIYRHLSRADLFAAIGTSGTVHPAAGFVVDARAGGAHTVELNLDPSEAVGAFAEAIHGRATEIVPAWVERLLSSGG